MSESGGEISRKPELGSGKIKIKGKEFEVGGVWSEIQKPTKKGKESIESELYFALYGDPRPLYNHLERSIDIFKKGGGNEGFLPADEEFGKIVELIDRCPGGEEWTKEELGDQAAEMVSRVKDKYKGKEKDLVLAWEVLREKEELSKVKKKTVDDKKRVKELVGKMKEVEENFGELKLVFDYASKHGGLPENFEWSQLGKVIISKKVIEDQERRIREGASEDNDLLVDLAASRAKIPSKAKRKLKDRAAKWAIDFATKIPLKTKAWDKIIESLKAGDQSKDLLRNSPQEYWRGKLLGALEFRLDQARGSFDFTQTGSNEEKLVWNFGGKPPKNENENVVLKGGYRVSELAYDDRQGYFREGEVASFLAKMNKKDFWEGKRRMDVVFWAKLMGQVEGDRNDVFAELTQDKIQNSDLRALAGGEAARLWGLDTGTVEALEILFGDVEEVWDKKENQFYYTHPTLKSGLDKLRKEKIVTERNIQEAIMIAQVYGMDMDYNSSSKDRRYTTENWTKYYSQGTLTDEMGDVYDLVGDGYGLTDTCVNKMYLFDPRGAAIAYAAHGVDRRRLNLEEHKDQRDEIWKTSYFYLGAGLGGTVGGMSDGGRLKNPKEIKDAAGGKIEPQLPGDVVLPGHIGEFLDYKNGLITTDKKTKKPVYIHRRVVYNKLRAVRNRDKELMGQGGKPGFEKNKGQLRKDVDELLKYFDTGQTDPLDPLGKTIGEINTKDRNRKMNDLLHKVLRNPYAWGIVFTLKDPDVVELMAKKNDLRVAMEYEVKAKKAAGILMGEGFGFEGYVLPENLNFNSAQLRGAVGKMAHRYSKIQNERQMWPAYELADMFVLKKLAKTFPDMNQLEQMYSAGGQNIGQLGSMKYAKAMIDSGEEWLGQRRKIMEVVNKQIADMGADSGIERTYIAQTLMGNAMFMYQDTKRRLNMISHGGIEKADGGAQAYIERLMNARALTWANAREFIWKTRNQIYGRVAEFVEVLEDEGERKYSREALLEKHQHLDIVWKVDGDGNLVGDKPESVSSLSYMDVTDKEMAEFFNTFEIDSSNGEMAAKVYKDKLVNKDLDLKGFDLKSESLMLVFKSEEDRLRFYMRRNSELMNLFMGVGGSDRIGLSDAFYTDEAGKTAGDGELVRGVHGVYEMAFAVERVNAYIAVMKIYQEGEISLAPLWEVDSKVEKLLGDLIKDSSLREEDAKMIRKEIDGSKEMGSEVQKFIKRQLTAVFRAPIGEIKIIGAIARFVKLDKMTLAPLVINGAGLALLGSSLQAIIGLGSSVAQAGFFGGSANLAAGLIGGGIGVGILITGTFISNRIGLAIKRLFKEKGFDVPDELLNYRGEYKPLN